MGGARADRIAFLRHHRPSLLSLMLIVFRVLVCAPEICRCALHCHFVADDFSFLACNFLGFVRETQFQSRRQIRRIQSSVLPSVRWLAFHGPVLGLEWQRTIFVGIIEQICMERASTRAIFVQTNKLWKRMFVSVLGDAELWHRNANKTKTQVYRSFFFFAFSLRPWCLTFSSILMRLCCFCVWPLLPLIYPFIRVYPLFVIISTFIAPHQWSRSALLECFLLNVTCVPMVYPCLPAYLDPACSYQDLSHFEFYLDLVFSFSVFICVQRILMNFPTPRKHHTLTTFFFIKNILDISFDVLFCYFHPVRYLLDWTEHCVRRQRRRKSQYFTSYSIFLNNVRNHQASTNSTFSWRSNQEPQTNKYI